MRVLVAYWVNLKTQAVSFSHFRIFASGEKSQSDAMIRAVLVSDSACVRYIISGVSAIACGVGWGGVCV